MKQSKHSPSKFSCERCQCVLSTIVMVNYSFCCEECAEVAKRANAVQEIDGEEKIVEIKNWETKENNNL